MKGVKVVPRVVRTVVHGWDALVLGGGLLEVTVLPDKGADIISLVHRPTGIDPLLRTAWGLQPPDAPPRQGSDGAAFLENYEGGWQALFPSVNGPADLDGVSMPFHGEVASRRWEHVILDEGDAIAAVRLSIESALVPLRLERTLRVGAERAMLEVEDVITNMSLDAAAPFVLGHHNVFGPPFVAAGGTLSLPGGTIVTLPEPWEPTARLAPGQRSAWPHALLADGGSVDLQAIPGVSAGSHDDVFVVDVPEGWATISSPLGLDVKLAWDAGVFGCVVLWMAYGGANEMPLTGTYALGVEPWTSRLSLPEAVAAGEARWLEPGQSFRTTMTLTMDASG
jgi:hypothetical protein